MSRSLAKTRRSLPKSSPLKVKVISLVKSLSPTKKTTVSSAGRKKLSWSSATGPRDEQQREKVRNFIEQPDISWCNPGRYGNVYCGKKDGFKICKAKHYLLNSLREIVSLYNEEHADEKPTTYYQIRNTVEREKHLILQDKKQDDDCRFEVCENAELLLDAAKTYLKKNEKNEIAKALPATTTEILESSVYSAKNQECMSGECNKCTTLNYFTDALEALEGIDEVSFSVWKTQDKKVQQVMDTLSGETSLRDWRLA